MVGNVFERGGAPRGRPHNRKGVGSLKEAKEEDLRKWYAAGLSLAEIGEKFGTSASPVSRVFSALGITRRWHDETGAIKNAKMSIGLTYAQEQLVLGSVLGDACLHASAHTLTGGRVTSYLRVAFTQGEAQQPYLEHKRSIMLTGRESLPKPCVSKISKSNEAGANNHWGGDIYQFAFCHTPTLRELERKYEMRDASGKIYVSQKWADAIDELAFTYWFLDDGNLQTTHAQAAFKLALATCAYDGVELERLCGVVKRMGGAAVKKSRCNIGGKKDQFEIRTSTKSEVLHLRSILLRHTPACMLHKLKNL